MPPCRLISSISASARGNSFSQGPLGARLRPSYPQRATVHRQRSGQLLHGQLRHVAPDLLWWQMRARLPPPRPSRRQAQGRRRANGSGVEQMKQAHYRKTPDGFKSVFGGRLRTLSRPRRRAASRRGRAPGVTDRPHADCGPSSAASGSSRSRARNQPHPSQPHPRWPGPVRSCAPASTGSDAAPV